MDAGISGICLEGIEENQERAQDILNRLLS
jgi:hypothetical protein